MSNKQAGSPSALAEVMTLQEVSRYLRIKPEQISKLAKTGRFPGRLVGNRWRFLRQEIDEYLTGVDLKDRANTEGGKDG